MTPDASEFVVSDLGDRHFNSPLQNIPFIDADQRVLLHSKLSEIETFWKAGKQPPAFDLAGPRKKIFFDPEKTKCGILTCGGLCPGLNDVIRSIVRSLDVQYGVKTVYGFRYGYEGLIPKFNHEPFVLTPSSVDSIHEMGGTILGSSRGNQDTEEMVNTLVRLGIQILFAVGGDGTLRGAHDLSVAIKNRSLPISVIGIPKTIDNDISYIQKSFGFETAVSEARSVLTAAHNEAKSAYNGIGLVKLMGRDSGFISAFASLSSGDVNFCLVPEQRFTLPGLMAALWQRLERKHHAVIAVAEGAGQDLMAGTGEKDASGNTRHQDIGVFLRDRIKEHFKKVGMEINLKYIDPSYTIRSQRANAHDSAFCLLLGQYAAHAGMAGFTDMVVGFWKQDFTYVPIPLAVSQRKKIELQSWMWNSVLSATEQPAVMEA